MTRQHSSSRPIRWIAGFAFALSVQCGAGLVAAQGLPVLRATPDLVDFGTVVEMLPVPARTVSITNISNVDLEFSEYYYPPMNLGLWMDCVHLRPGESCLVSISLDTRALGPGQSSVDVYAYLNGSSATLPPVEVDVRWNLIPGRIVFSEAELDFGMRPIGDASAQRTVKLTNTGPVERDLTWRLSGTECATFDVTPPRCIAQRTSYAVSGACPDTLPPGASCVLTITFQPVTGGNLIAVLNVDFAGALPLVGGGVPVPQRTTGTVLAVEYFNAALGHYFLTVTPHEMEVLDAQGATGWQRTGQSFWVYPADGSAPAGTSPVCRYYGRPEAGLDSHFYSASTAECGAVADRYPAAWILESESYFRAYLPRSDGGCADDAAAHGATTWLYRAYNNRPDANHRFTTSQYLLYYMHDTRGWVPEGYGLYSNAMCLP